MCIHDDDDAGWWERHERDENEKVRSREAQLRKEIAEADEGDEDDAFNELVTA